MDPVTFNPDQNIFYVDVGNIPPRDIPGVIQRYREQFQNMNFRALPPDAVFMNPNPYPVCLQGEDGKAITIASMEKRALPYYFERYCPGGHLTIIDPNKPEPKTNLLRGPLPSEESIGGYPRKLDLE